MQPSQLPHRRVIAALFGTLKVMQMYGREHDATRDALRTLTDAVIDAAEDGETRVGVRGNRLHVNDKTMRPSECGTLALSFLAGEWVRRKIAAVRFLADVTTRDLTQFADLFLNLDLSSPDPVGMLATELVNHEVSGVTLERLKEQDVDPVVLEERRENAMRTYMRGLHAFKEVLRCDGVRDPKTMRRARRAVQGLVDRFLEDESAVLALAQIRSHDEKLFRHSLNVCVYALLLGQRLGMTRRQLGELGLAALFHDVGRTLPRRSGESDADELLEHPGRGARVLLDEQTAHEGMLKAALAAYEHHVHFDGSGFPAVHHTPHLVSRIVSIADCYEALTSKRTYDELTHTAYDVLCVMQRHAGSVFDPLLLKVFINALGIYPVGTLVQLSTGEVGLVIEGPADYEHVGRPSVKVLLTATGSLEPEAVVDLLDTDEGERPIRSIERTLVPNEVFSDVAEYVAAI